MRTARATAPRIMPALTRMTAVTPLDEDAAALIYRAEQNPRRVAAKRDLVSGRERVRSPLMVLDGWAATICLLPDGRRQIISFVLPGELVGVGDQGYSENDDSVVALTDLSIASLPRAGDLPAGSGLGDVYATSRLLNDRFLRNQIVRIGRLDAYERITDLLLELHDRLALAGLANEGSFQLPLTQESLADALGLTSVHVNRMLQLLRRDGLLTLKAGVATLPDLPGLARVVGRRSQRETWGSS